jgi:hypothetical protein
VVPHTASASADLDAPADRVYHAVADYREGHPRIIPKPPFVSLEVEEGGYGAGTVIRCAMKIGAMTSTFRAAVSEPQPGRRLVETDLAGGPVTTFTCEPLADGRTRATISTLLQRNGKKVGMLERWLIIRFLRKVYHEELRLLEVEAKREVPGG